nr:hypothetical protein [Tanacetum cinerariifolium]
AVRLRDETQALKECNIDLEKEKSKLEVKVTELAASVKVREQEVADLDAVVTSVKLQNDSLADQVHKLEASSVGLQEKVTVYENCMSQLKRFQDEKINELLTHGMELAITKFLNSTKYLSAFEAAIGKAIKKGMQEGLSAGTEGTSGAATDTTTALFVTSISTSTILPISTDDYEIPHTEGGEGAVADVEAVADEGANPFPDVADIPCSWKGVSIVVSKPIRSLHYTSVTSYSPSHIDKVSWREACASDPGVVISFHFGFALCFLYCKLLSLFLQEIQPDSQGFIILDYINFCYSK